MIFNKTICFPFPEELVRTLGHNVIDVRNGITTLFSNSNASEEERSEHLKKLLEDIENKTVTVYPTVK